MCDLGTSPRNMLSIAARMNPLQHAETLRGRLDQPGKHPVPRCDLGQRQRPGT